MVVLKELRSSEVRDEQPWNIPPMFVTLVVLKELRSSEVKDEQPQNIYSILVTLVVVRFEIPVIVVNFSQLWNHLLNEVG